MTSVSTISFGSAYERPGVTRRRPPVLSKASQAEVCYTCHKVGEAGMDFGPDLTTFGRQQPIEVQAQSVGGLHNWIETIRTYPKPVIAAVEGAAAGAGFSLALACDFIVAARNAVFVMAYSNVALSPDGGASWSLSHALPRQVATEILMCGDRISAERLHALGVVNRIAETGSALETALALAEQLNARAPNALASIKELLNEAPHAQLTHHLAHERDHFVKNLHHANGGAGISAFLEKRVPRYE